MILAPEPLCHYKVTILICSSYFGFYFFNYCLTWLICSQIRKYSILVMRQNYTCGQVKGLSQILRKCALLQTILAKIMFLLFELKDNIFLFLQVKNTFSQSRVGVKVKNWKPDQPNRTLRGVGVRSVFCIFFPSKTEPDWNKPRNRAKPNLPVRSYKSPKTEPVTPLIERE